MAGQLFMDLIKLFKQKLNSPVILCFGSGLNMRLKIFDGSMEVWWGLKRTDCGRGGGKGM